MTPVVSKPWYLSKTIWLAIVAGILSIVLAVQSNYPDVAVFGTIVSVLSIINRFLTTLPISSDTTIPPTGV